MPDLRFTVQKAEPVLFAAAPLLAFQIGVANTPADEVIHSVVLRCQIQIEATRRQYGGPDQERLRELFGESARWGQTLRNLLWTHANAVVTPFSGSTNVDLHVPCSFDFNIAATKYFHGLTGGEIPLCLMFSGTVFYADSDGALRVAPIPWDKEAHFRLPLEVWKEMMDLYYPNTAWLCLRRDVFDRLQEYKTRNTIPTWEQTMEQLLGSDGKAVHA